MKINLSAPDISQADIDAVVAVLQTPRLSLGPKLPEFEEKFAALIGRKYAVAVNSGTSALHCAVRGLGIGPGDEVITSAFSFISSSNCILFEGARPIFVDIDPVDYNIDVTKIEAAVTTRTKAILPVDVFGRPARLERIEEIAARHDLKVIEDSCEALGSTYQGRPAGAFGDCAAFAFYPNKQITTGEGGLLVTDDQELARLARSLRNQGRGDGAGWLAHQRLGYNYRLSDINCALGISQLARLGEFIEKRAAVADRYNRLLADRPEVVRPAPYTEGTISWFVYVIRLADRFGRADRDAVLEALRSRGIGCNNYFTPIHLQPFYREKFGHAEGDLPVTEAVCERTIALPFHNNLCQADQQTVVQALGEALESLKT
ncbi:MAG: aminotransferase class I/II-fold pyridoxal phosphate-dependent enzyme [Anaerolineaceae bacterium]|nr:aminotransferase class I/II-fold pyridoxal phosphate-dependent enzyme [Anaerolineaceae bacterium]